MSAILADDGVDRHWEDEMESGGGGIRTPCESSEETALSPQSGAKSGALAAGLVSLDPDLAHVLDAWAKLPTHIKSAILALIGTAG